MIKASVVCAILLCSVLVSAKETGEWGEFIPAADNTCAKKGELTLTADFDGNGKKDIARLQQNKEQVRLAVWMNGEKTPFVLAEEAAANAGNYLTLAKLGEIKAFDGVTESKYKVTLPSPVYGTCESSAHIYQWDKKSKKFARTTISD